MALEHIDKFYCGLTSQPPYGLALVGRRHDGRVVVGAAYENDWALKPILDALKELLKKHRIGATEIRGFTDDSEAWIEIAERGKRITGIDFQGIYQPMSACRQALATLIVTQGPSTSRFQIDRDAPGAELLAQRIEAKQFSGVLDGVSVCALAIENDFPGGVAPNYKPPVVELRRPDGSISGWSGR